MLSAFALLGIAGIVTYTMTNRQHENTRWVAHTHVVINTLDALSDYLAEARTYLTTDDAEPTAGEAAIEGASDAVRRLRALTTDNEVQQRGLDRLEPLVQELLARIEEAHRMLATRPADVTRAGLAIRRADAVTVEVASVIAALLAEERRLLVIRDGAIASGATRGKIILLAGTSLSVALLALAFLGLHRESRRRVEADLALSRSEAATRALNEDLERRVRARTLDLETSNRELESFSYAVAHDLRTPLRGISGFSEILLQEYKDKLDAECVDALQEIRDNACKMGLLIDALLSLARVRRSELRASKVDLTALVHQVVAKLQAAEPRAQLELRIAEDVEAQVDPELACTLVSSLIENAWKFTSKVAVPRIEFGATDADGQRTFFVRDNGAGFAMDHSAKLFAPFHRMHTVVEFPGIGIGLSTAQRIVARFGGRIWAAGQVDRGATFYFTLSANPRESTS